jgi:sucrose-phosphate synthase
MARIAFLNPQGNFDPRNSYLASHPDFGGQLVYVREVARTLGKMGHRADILTRRMVDPEWPEFASETDAYPGHENVRILRIPCGPEHFLPKEELWPYLGEWAEGVERLYRKEGLWPDLWTGHYADGGLAAALLEEASGVPFTFTGHSLGAWKLDSLLQDSEDAEDLREADARYNFGARIAAERAAMARSAVIVTSSEAERREQYEHPAYKDVAGVEEEGRFAVIPPGVDFDIFDPGAQSPQEEETRTRIRAAHERDINPGRHSLPAVIAWSRLDPKKNHLALVEAFATHPELRERVNLVVITRGLEDPLHDPDSVPEEEQPVLRALISGVERSGLWGCVSAFDLSGQSNLAALYRWGTATGGVFCLPAEYEPFGMTVVEAMAAGLPAVVTKFGGPSESMRDGDEEYGILVDPTDPEDVGAGLHILTSSQESWKRYAEAGYGRVLARYTWERTAEGYLEAISGGKSDADTGREEGATTLNTGDDQGVVSANGGRPQRRLQIPPYFMDPASGAGTSLETLDELYYRLDLLAVGETMVDFISHEMAHSLRTADQFSRYLGGQPANVAVYVAKLGGRSAIITKLGSDYFGEYVEDQLQHHGVNTEAVSRTDEAATTNAFVTRTVSIPDFQVNRGADALLALHQVDEEMISRARIVHTSAFALSKDPQRLAVRRAMRLGSRLGKIVTLDPNYDPRVWPDRVEAWEVLAEVMPYATIVKPSLEDARRLFDFNMDEETLEETAIGEFHDLGAKTVILTRSGGVVTVSEDGNLERVGPLPKAKIENVTGARDAFWSALLMAHLDVKDWPEAIRFAHEVASLKLRVEGHVERMIDREDLYASLLSSGTRAV